MGRSFLSISGIFGLGLGLILLNTLTARLFQGVYVDLTQEGLYTLSEGTKNILSKLQDPVTLKVYMSKTESAKYPAIKLYQDRVLSLLREYKRSGKGKVEIEVYDPRPDTDEESWAQKYGLSALQMPSGEKVFFGLVAVNSRGNEEIIPVFSLSRQEHLEYDITRILNALGSATKPAVGLISTLKIAGLEVPQMLSGRMPNSEPWVLISQLNKLAEIKTLPLDVAEIDPSIKLLMLVHPKGLTSQALYAIDQFVMRGGNLFVALDPYCQIDQPEAGNPGAPAKVERSSNLPELLTKWGVQLVEKKVVGDSELATDVRASEESGPESFPMWISLDSGIDPSTIDRTDVVTAELDRLLLPWPGALKKLDVPGVTFTPILKSSPSSMLFGEEDYAFGGGNPKALREKFIPGGEAQIFAARVEGKLTSNFSEPPAGVAQKADSPHLKESSGVSHVFVVSDVDFLADFASVAVQNFLGAKMVSLLNDNLLLAGNLVENLLGSNDLISLRSRGQFTRPFTRVRAIEQAAEERWRNEEMVLQASLNAANQRLSQLQSGTEKAAEGESVLNEAVLAEVKKFREQRADAQHRLREVRRNLRQDKERLGQWLFVLNTFVVPFLLIVGVFVWNRYRPRPAK